MSFAAATTVTRSEGGFTAAIEAGWDIGGNANGGYLMALAARAMAEDGGPHPVTLTAHFLAPGRPGPVDCKTTVIKRGKRFATVRGSLLAGDKNLVELLGSFTDSKPTEEGPLRVDAAPPDLPAPGDCVRLTPAVGAPALMGKFDLRLHPDDAGFAFGKPSGQPLVRGWLQFPDESMDVFGLMLAADAFPATLFNANLPIAWAPTLEMTTHIRGLPEPGWLRCRFATRFISGGMLEEDGEIWDASGTLVAQSRQLALVPQSLP